MGCGGRNATEMMKIGRSSFLLLAAMQIVNQAPWDRLLRIVIGVATIYVGWIGSPDGLVGAALRVFGPVPLLTGLLGWDPLYALLGIATRKK